MPNDQRLTIWGRPNSVNVQKVLWCLAELDVPFERIDAGMQFGRNTESDYLAMNPNGRVPTLVEGDFVLWESNSIMRYLCLAHGPTSSIYPPEPQRRAAVDRWLDWTLSTVQPLERPLFWGLVRTPPAERDMAGVAEGCRRGRRYGLEGARPAARDASLCRRRCVHAGRHRTLHLCAALVRR